MDSAVPFSCLLLAVPRPEPWTYSVYEYLVGVLQVILYVILARIPSPGPSRAIIPHDVKCNGSEMEEGASALCCGTKIKNQYGIYHHHRKKRSPDDDGDDDADADNDDGGGGGGGVRVVS